jgi:RNA polymerase sigma-70 factor (ECF subfamily)
LEVKELIRLCLLGDQEGQRLLYKKYASAMARLCQRYIKDTDDVQDVIIEGFTKIFRRLGDFEYRGDQSLEIWVRKIMVNECLMTLRKRKTAMFVDQEDQTVEVAAIENTDLSSEEILALIRLLPDGYRTVFNLAVIEGYSHAEIAELLGISESASRSQLTHARNKLKFMLRKHGWNE